MTIKKIGLLGGTFDPVHFGHLQLAAAAKKECGLDKVVFIPSAEPPHKNCSSISSFKDRLAMLVLAGADKDGYECSTIEEELPKPSYTIDTLRALRKQYQADCRLYFMIGADAFLDILTWKSYGEILTSVNIILSKREGYRAAELYILFAKLGYTKSANSWRGKDEKKNIFILDKTPVNQSSSTIRARIAKNESVQRLLPESVLAYIQKNGLYLPENSGSSSCSGHCGDQ